MLAGHLEDGGNESKRTFVTSLLEELIKLTQITTAKAVVIAHQDSQSIARGCQTQCRGEHCGERNAHLQKVYRRAKSPIEET
jgi:hypothetical protein